MSINYRNSINKKAQVGYGFSYGQVEVIKLQHYHFSRTYRQIAKHYKSNTPTIRKLVESKQFADIQPVGGLYE